MIGLFLAEGFEEIEALLVVDVLRRASIDVKTISIQDEMVTGGHDITVKADLLLSDIDNMDFEMMILPGGMPGVKNLDKCEKLKDLLEYNYKKKNWIAAICAAPKIIGSMGFLENREATCYPGFEKYLVGAIIKDERAIVDDHVITSKGPGTAIDFAHRIVCQLKDLDSAGEILAAMQV